MRKVFSVFGRLSEMLKRSYYKGRLTAPNLIQLNHLVTGF